MKRMALMVINQIRMQICILVILEVQNSKKTKTIIKMINSETLKTKSIQNKKMILLEVGMQTFKSHHNQFKLSIRIQRAQLLIKKLKIASKSKHQN